MRPPSEQQAIRQVQECLAELLSLAPSEVEIRTHPDAPQPDAIFHVGRFTFVLEWKGSGGSAPVSRAIQQVQQYTSALEGDAIPLVGVPFMGPIGRKHCEEAGVAWLDLSGNAKIFAPGLRIRIEGYPNRFKHPGRPSSAFAPKSARIARWLLMHPDQPCIQSEIALATQMDPGFTSRIVSRLEQDGLIFRDPEGVLRVPDPDLLLDAWREDYDFSKHQILRGHMPARSGTELLQRLAAALLESKAAYAATGLAAAWLLNRFAGFRTVTLYLPELPPPALLEQFGFREEVSGANVWLVLPNDEGVFHGIEEQDGIRCVHPVQTYLDLAGHPERAEEVAQNLRATMLRWRNDD